MGFWQAAGTIGSALLGGIIGNKQRDRDFERQRQANIEFWNMQNEYLHPSRQVERLREAGLSPSLLYGNSAQGASGGSSNLQAPQLATSQYQSPLSVIPEQVGKYFDTRVKAAQTNLLGEQTKKAREEQILLSAKALGEKMRNAKTKQEVDEFLSEEFKKYRLASGYSETMKKHSEYLRTNMDYNLKKIMYGHIQKMNPMERKYLSEKIRMLEKNADWRQMMLDAYELFGGHTGWVQQVLKAYLLAPFR